MSAANGTELGGHIGRATWTLLVAAGRVLIGILEAGVAGLVAAIAYPIAQGMLAEPVNALRSAIRELDATLTDTARFWANPSPPLKAEAPALAEVKQQSARLRASVSHLISTSNAVRWRRLWTLTRLLPAHADVEEARKLLTRVCTQFVTGAAPAPDVPPPGRQNLQDVTDARRLLGLPESN
jgi:hypothetical protein